MRVVSEISQLLSPGCVQTASDISSTIAACALSQGNPSTIVALRCPPSTLKSRTFATSPSGLDATDKLMEFKNLSVSEFVDTVTLRSSALGKIPSRDTGCGRRIGGTL
jgi:hypothetical protein